MNTRFGTLTTLFTLLAILLGACASAAAPTQVASQPKSEEQVAPQEPAPMVLPTAPEAPAMPPVFAPQATAAYAGTGAQPFIPIPGKPAPQDNYFQNYGVNPFEDPREDHLSTFSLDVDTASYSVARRYVNDGNLPPADAVRVEEFVNYFKQDYPTPADIAFGLYADGAPSPFNTDGTYFLRFGVQGYQVLDEDRKPASLTFVIDVSGSMAQENRLELVKQSLQMLVDRLRPADTVAIVVYGSDAHVMLYPTSGEDRNYILNTIYSLQSEGSTNAEAGLRLGYQLAWQAFRPGMINRVILCSDGVANVGATGPEAILEQIRGYADQGITLTTVGFGMGNFNDVLMEQLADGGDGHYAYVDDLDEARRLFVEDMTSTLQVIAYDAKIQVDFNPDIVARYRLVGYENRAVADQDFRNDAVDAGEIGAGHSATALYAIMLQPGAEGRIATVQLRWQNTETRQVQEINGNFNTWDLAPSFDHASPHYQLSVIAAQYAEILRRSPWATEVSIYDLLPISQRLAGLLSDDPDVAEFSALVSRACLINELIR
jgi:Ca-activated chloride channel family protein